MSRRTPLTAEQRLTVAKDSIDNGAPPDYALAHALIALTETLRDWLWAEPDNEPAPVVSWQGGAE